MEVEILEVLKQIDVNILAIRRGVFVLMLLTSFGLIVSFKEHW